MRDAGEFAAPHKFPQSAIDADADVIAWRCEACGEWVSEFKRAPDNCSVDWRRR